MNRVRRKSTRRLIPLFLVHHTQFLVRGSIRRVPTDSEQKHLVKSTFYTTAKKDKSRHSKCQSVKKYNLTTFQYLDLKSLAQLIKNKISKFKQYKKMQKHFIETQK